MARDEGRPPILVDRASLSRHRGHLPQITMKRKNLIIGLGKSGRSAYDLLTAEGEDVVGVDDNTLLLQQLSQEGLKVDATPCIDQFDRVIISPGISPHHSLYCQALLLKKEIVGEAELAFSRLRQLAVAITGTNGKTTVTLLVEHVLKTSGRKAKALGNVGVPLTAYVKNADPEEIIVAEVSSYQLETMQTQAFDRGIILNITPDHLDRYPSMQAYAMTKCHLQDCIKPGGELWVHQTVADEFEALLRPGYKTFGTDKEATAWTDQTALKREENIEVILPIIYRRLGEHESENVLAAWIVCAEWGVDAMTFLAAIETFQKPAHRIEFVASLDHVDYFDDSKGTNLDATIKAVQAMSGHVILIAGGVDKGASYEPWKKVFAGKVKRVLAIGEAAAKIARELSPEFDVDVMPSLEEAVRKAHRDAVSGDSVLLSPGCSSFDWFKDYAHRGQVFKRCVQQLLEERRKE
jgi:UDP-N-acetylmuramoylalanine--D-glutamate ligase